MDRDKFIKAVTKVDDQHSQDIPVDEYVDVCQELIDFFTERRDAAIDDMEHEDA